MDKDITEVSEAANDPPQARHDGSSMSGMLMAENRHDAHMQAGREALQQGGHASTTARNPDAMQSYATAEDATLDHAMMNHDGAAMAGMDHATISADGAVVAMDHAKMAAMDHTKMKHSGMSHDMSDPVMAKAMEADMRNRFFVALILTIPVILYSPLGQSLLHVTLPTPIPVNWLLFILTTPIVFWAGWIFVGGAFSALRARQLDMSVLIATGVLTAYLFSAYITFTGGSDTFYDAAAMLVTFVLFGHWMEMRSRKGTTESLRALFDLVPPQATVIRDGKEVQVNTADVVVGDLIRIRPGDKLPVDGVVVEGETNINEALVTGESLPVAKQTGDAVIGGSINQSGSIVMKATRVGADTTIGQITSMVRIAQNSKAPGQRLADKAATVLVIVAVGSGLATFLAWKFVGVPTIVALTFAISAVVIACPDALGLATPTAVAVGIGLGAKHNVLIKDAATLEGVSGIKAIVLDKTGTLTEGRPKLTDIMLAEGAGIKDDEVLRLVASAEGGSEHPLAEAIVNGAKERGLQLSQASAFNSLSGRGLEATVDGKAVLVGNQRLLDERRANIPLQILEQATQLADNGRTPMFVAIDGRIAGIVAVADTVKPDAKQTIALLKQRGIEPVMITGDNQRVAAAVARELGIERYYAEVLPQDKARYVRELQAEGKKVAMVGDGVNDAPALATADIGIAIGAGTDVAIETANIVLMKSDPLDIVRALILSSATVVKMKQNLFWASIYNLLAIPVAAGLFYSSLGWQIRPEIAALLMSVSSIIVATNAVLLRSVEGKLNNPVVSKSQ